MSARVDGGLRLICRRLFCTLLKWPLGNQGTFRKADGFRLRRILVLRHDGVPHMVASLPAFRLIKRLAPNCRLDVLASEGNFAVAEQCPEVDEAFVLPGGWMGRLGKIASLRKRDYDLVLNLMLSDTSENGLIANLVGGRKALKVAHYPRLEHSVFYNIQALSANRGISLREKLPMVVADAISGYAEPENEEPSLAPHPRYREAATLALGALGLTEGNFIVIHWEARDSEYKWSEAACRDLIQQVWEHLGLKVLVICQQLDDSDLEALQGRLPGSTIYPAGAPLLELAAAIARARLLVASDLALRQVGYGLGVPVVSLCPSTGGAHGLWRPLEGMPEMQIVAPLGCGVSVIQTPPVWEAVLRLAVRY